MICLAGSRVYDLDYSFEVCSSRFRVYFLLGSLSLVMLRRSEFWLGVLKCFGIVVVPHIKHLFEKDVSFCVLIRDMRFVEFLWKTG